MTMSKKVVKKLIEVAMLILVGVFGVGIKVFADNEICARLPYSQNEYYEYVLSWETRDSFNWDLLSKVTKDDNIVAYYMYDDNNNRYKKIVGDKEILFNYSDDNRIISVQNENGVILYNYEYDEILDKYNLLGFTYNGSYYFFEFLNGVIVNITDQNGNVLVKYDYGDYCEDLVVYENVNGTYIVNDSDNFIGNINRIVYNMSYYDDETGWYYNRRYYDPIEGRYVDGISYEQAMQEIENLEEDNAGLVLSRIYSWGAYINPNSSSEIKASRISGLGMEEEVVARTLYAEAGTGSADWQAVAWVVYNRKNSSSFNGSTAYAIVTDGDNFSSYYNKSKEYCNPDTTSPRWTASITNAKRLQGGETPSYSVSYISTQVYFRSYNSFVSGYSGTGTDSEFNGKVICDMAIPGVTQISYGISNMEIVNRYNRYNGVYNFYFNYMN